VYEIWVKRCGWEGNTEKKRHVDVEKSTERYGKEGEGRDEWTDRMEYGLSDG